MTHHNRSTDVPQSTDDEIMRMVQETNDPQTKGMLLVLLRISNNLAANTRLTSHLSESFEAHVDKVNAYMLEGNKMLNRGIGAWKAVSLIGIIVYVVGGFLLSGYITEINNIKQRNIDQDIIITRVSAQLEEHLKQTIISNGAVK